VSAPKRKRSVDALAVPSLATKRRRVLEDPIARQPPSMFGTNNTIYQLDRNLFVTHRPPRLDAIPLDLLHPVFGEFVQNYQNNLPNTADVQLVESLQGTFPKYWDKELDQCEEFRSILAEHYKEIELSPGSVGGTTRTTDGHVSIKGLLIVVFEGKRVGGDAEVQGSMFPLTAFRARLEKLGLLGSRFPFPSIIITLIGT